jgi:cyclophilin family peptidyl-prolyl cis-trans isomerase
VSIILAAVSRPLLALAAASTLALAACGGGDGSGSTQPAPTPAATTAAAALPAGCRAVPAPAARKDGGEARPSGRLAAGRTWTAQLQTNCGTIAIRLATGRAPRTAASFAALVRRGFYTGLTFHRIAGDPASGPFVIQGGDPLGTGLGGPGFSVVERPPGSARYTRGTVAMAKTQSEPAGASGSQFFIVTAPDAGLPPEYALVGRVSSGMDVVQRIASVATDAQERPSSPVVIERATLLGGT